MFDVDRRGWKVKSLRLPAGLGCLSGKSPMYFQGGARCHERLVVGGSVHEALLIEAFAASAANWIDNSPGSGG